MLLYCTETASGLRSLHLEPIAGEPGSFRLRRDDGTTARLSGALIEKLMRRYGRELDAEVEPDGEELALGAEFRLQAFRWRAGVDASGRDYIALHQPNGPRLACMATHIAAALEHLMEKQS